MDVPVGFHKQAHNWPDSSGFRLPLLPWDIWQGYAPSLELILETQPGPTSKHTSSPMNPTTTFWFPSVSAHVRLCLCAHVYM